VGGGGAAVIAAWGGAAGITAVAGVAAGGDAALEVAACGSGFLGFTGGSGARGRERWGR
jgi:hypothetical protein